MDWLQVITLALIQGLSEFLPVSSSAHLLLVPLLTDWPDQGLAFDIAVHFGSLIAVMVYFRSDLVIMARAWVGSLSGHHSAESRLAWGIIWATVPVAVCGFLAKGWIETGMRSGALMGYTLVGFGLLLGYADWRYSRRLKRNPDETGTSEYQLSRRQILGVALAQTLALIPGTSRSGITMTAGLLLGMSREAAARFSFLLSIPVIVLAAGLQSMDWALSPAPVDWPAVIVGTALAGFSAYICIHWFLAVIRRLGMQPFVLYRVVFGLYLLTVFA